MALPPYSQVRVLLERLRLPIHHELQLEPIPRLCQQFQQHPLLHQQQHQPNIPDECQLVDYCCRLMSQVLELSTHYRPRFLQEVGTQQILNVHCSTKRHNRHQHMGTQIQHLHIFPSQTLVSPQLIPHSYRSQTHQKRHKYSLPIPPILILSPLHLHLHQSRQRNHLRHHLHNLEGFLHHHHK